jgi:hypothetical protein
MVINRKIPSNYGLREIQMYRISVVPALFLIMTVSANASYVYSYTGNTFDGFSSPSSWDASMYVSGMFALQGALGQNLINSPVAPTSFSFTDGVTTITSADVATNPLLYNVDFRFSTDTNGVITDWDVFLDFGQVSTPFSPGTLGNIGDTLARIHAEGGVSEFGKAASWDVAVIYTCTAINSDSTCATEQDTGGTVTNPGAWTVSSVPIPSAFWLFGTGVLGLIGASRCGKVVCQYQT